MQKLGLLIFILVFLTVFSANGQALKVTRYEPKDCLKLNWDKESIITNQTEFLQIIHNDMRRERCLKELKRVNFEKQDLVGVDINSGYCHYPLGLVFGANKSVQHKQFELNISFLKPNGVCRARSSYHLWLLIPKISAEYKLELNISAREK